MLIDSHIHVGQFYSMYISPNNIHTMMDQLGVSYYVVSSTTQCEENYPKVISEFEELIRLDGHRVLPVMWITPQALKGNIAWYLESNIKWRMIKIHPYLNKKEWNPTGNLFAEVIDIAKEMNLPLLIHTGDEECCKADIYETAIANNPNIKFVLAHGQPIQSAVRIAKLYSNAYIDSAFMPIEHMNLFTANGLSEKLLWGTDSCIPHFYFPNIDIIDYYKNKLDKFKRSCTQNECEMVLWKNAIKLFNIDKFTSPIQTNNYGM